MARRPAAPSRRPTAERARLDRRHALRASTERVYRAAILAAAERVLARDGFDAAKMADIAREAGVAAGTLYNYFDSKSAIVTSLIEELAEQHFAEVEPIVRGDGPPLSRLARMIEAGLRFLDAHRAMFTIFVERGEHRPSEQMIERHQERRQKLYERLIREAIADGELRGDVSPADQAAFLIGTLHGFVHGCFARGVKKPLERITPLVLDLFQHGTGARS